MLVLAVGSAIAAPGTTIAYRVEGDAVGSPLASAGDISRGRDVVLGRDANCLLCHAVPDAGARFMGDLAPALAGVGARLSEGQLRLRLVDSMRLNPNTIMPSYYRTDGLNQVGAAWRGKPILTAQQIEDAVAYLRTLR
jgi:sulfur-oxidizing protein SoxX